MCYEKRISIKNYPETQKGREIGIDETSKKIQKSQSRIGKNAINQKEPYNQGIQKMGETIGDMGRALHVEDNKLQPYLQKEHNRNC